MSEYVQSFNKATRSWSMIEVKSGATIRIANRKWPDIPEVTKDKLIAFREETPQPLNVKPSDPLSDYR